MCTILYILMALVMTGLAPYKELAVPHPVFVAIDHAGPKLKWLGYAVNVGAIAGLASVVMVLLLSQSRVFYTMARDGLIFPLFAKIHPHFRTPHLGTLVIGLCSGLVAAALPIGVIGHLVSLGTLSAFVMVCAGIWVLRRLHPELARPFRAPWVPVIPIFGMLSCGYMMVSLPRETWELFIGWMAIGVVIYFLYGRRHSRISQRHA
jgi:APA family basic amino acid/polyamine antiporter